MPTYLPTSYLHVAKKVSKKRTCDAQIRYVFIDRNHITSHPLLFPPFPHSYVLGSILSINQGLGNISLKRKREREREGYKKQGKKRKGKRKGKEKKKILDYIITITIPNHHKENRRVGQVDQVGR